MQASEEPLDHVCWWTRRGRTELHLQGNLFTSAGISLRILLNALVEPGLAWFSTIYGELGDNVLIAAVGESESKKLPHERYPENGPVAKSLAGLLDVKEYVLSDAVTTLLNLSFTEDIPPSQWSKAVRYIIDIHDDCLALIQPVSDARLSRLIAQVLCLHNRYLGMEVDWHGVTEELTELLRSCSAIRLESEKVDWWQRKPVVHVEAARSSWQPDRPIKFYNAGFISFDSGAASVQIKLRNQR